jgi:hypothetical protein
MRDADRVDMLDYIEGLYNTVRRGGVIGYLRTVEFGKKV